MSLVKFEERRPFFTEEEVIKAYAEKEKLMTKTKKAAAKTAA